MALARFQVAPVMVLVAKLTEDVSKTDINAGLGKIMLDTEMGSSLVSLGKEFLTADHSPSGK